MQVPVELKKKYLERRREDLKALFNSLEQNDFSQALRIGHQVKGNAKTFEFPQMAILGIEIENAARNQDKDRVVSLIQLMSQQIHLAQKTIS